MGFSGGAETRYKKYPCKGSCERKSYETIVRTSFLGTRPSCPPSPWWRFFDTDDRKPNLWLGRKGSPVITRKIRSTESKCTLKNLKLLKVFSSITVSPGQSVSISRKISLSSQNNHSDRLGLVYLNLAAFSTANSTVYGPHITDPRFIYLFILFSSSF